MFDPDLLRATVDFLADLAGPGSALEFAIGTGRVALPLRTRGVPVAGIDISAPMVAQLRRQADAARLPVVIGDMTSATLPGRHSLVYLVFSGLSNLLTQQAQIDCFANATRHLAPGGACVVEMWVPQLPRPAAPQASVGRNDDGVSLSRSPHRHVWPAEQDLMARLAGFTRESRYADWHKTPFTATSQSQISVYRLA